MVGNVKDLVFLSGGTSLYLFSCLMCVYSSCPIPCVPAVAVLFLRSERSVMAPHCQAKRESFFILLVIEGHCSV